MTDLASRSALNWVVRARDLALNHDGNLVEVSGVTLTSYARDVLPVLARNCAVVGCHVTGPQGGGLNLAPAFAYEQLVNRNAIQAPIPRVSTGVDPLNNSYLYEKIAKIPRAGAVMPAPQTGNTLNPDDKSVITSWILEGAKRN